jgi:hypothetical protein
MAPAGARLYSRRSGCGGCNESGDGSPSPLGVAVRDGCNRRPSPSPHGTGRPHEAEKPMCSAWTCYPGAMGDCLPGPASAWRKFISNDCSAGRIRPDRRRARFDLLPTPRVLAAGLGNRSSPPFSLRQRSSSVVPGRAPARRGDDVACASPHPHRRFPGARVSRDRLRCHRRRPGALDSRSGGRPACSTGAPAQQKAQAITSVEQAA